MFHADGRSVESRIASWTRCINHAKGSHSEPASRSARSSAERLDRPKRSRPRDPNMTRKRHGSNDHASTRGRTAGQSEASDTPAPQGTADKRGRLQEGATEDETPRQAPPAEKRGSPSAEDLEKAESGRSPTPGPGAPAAAGGANHEPARGAGRRKPRPTGRRPEPREAPRRAEKWQAPPPSHEPSAGSARGAGPKERGKPTPRDGAQPAPGTARQCPRAA